MAILEGPFLPETTRQTAGRFPIPSRNPGLHLDKFTRIAFTNHEVKKQKKEALKQVVQCRGDSSLLKRLIKRRTAMLSQFGASRIQMTTAGPLTLHVSRAGTWENASICLHPVYGFAYLPGSGIKGLVRSWAETVWAQEQSDQAKAWHSIDELFGCSTNSESHKYKSANRVLPGWRPDGLIPKQESAAGRLVFHDAWPWQWPKLEVDITNNHHTQYYGGGPNAAPGDWEDPVPVYFLCISSKTVFEFAISDRKRLGDGAVELAADWLTSALVSSGAGAKTAAGYGRFTLVGTQRAKSQSAPNEQQYNLELVSPAFLAGAEQGRKDCDLRGSTLRGLLRWWWRMIYAGKVKLEDLRRLETAIWGSTESGSPVQIALEHLAGDPPQQFSESTLFLQQHGIRAQSRNIKTMGLYYASFGMAEKRCGMAEKRWYRPEGSRWRVTFTVRNSGIPGNTKPVRPVTADDVASQAAAALWLLCRHGGVGAKSRKGFGSLADLEIPGIDSWETLSGLADDFLRRHGIQAAVDKEYGPSLSGAFNIDLPTKWASGNPWYACHMIGEVMKEAALSLAKHDRGVLGLPRNSHDGKYGLKRHASPALWSLGRLSNGNLSVRVLALPSPKLPSMSASRGILRRFLTKVETEISRLSGRRPAPAAGHPEPPRPAGMPNPGDEVEAEILVERTKKGGLKARHIDSGWTGHIMGVTPSEPAPGQRVKLFIHAIHAARKEVSFKWERSARPRSAAARSNRSNRNHRGRRRRR